jgi:hypothetical protein
MAELKGGTTGQILSKTSATDMDFTWITNDVGDITAVTAGTGISGGGTSGAVTITNDMATTITAAGDIVVGTGSGTYDNLPIGTTAQVLTADTTVSPYKVKWATPASSSPKIARLTKTASQSVTSSTYTNITWDSELIDTSSFHDNVTNNQRITVPTAGYYKFFIQLEYAANGTGERDIFYLLNATSGSGTIVYKGPGSSVDNFSHQTTFILNLAANDFVIAQTYQTSGGALNIVNQCSFFQVDYLGA